MRLPLTLALGLAGFATVSHSVVEPESDIVLTQIPAHPGLERPSLTTGGMLPADYGIGGRLVLLQKGGKVRVLTRQFHSAADPEVSFDGKKILFAGKRKAEDFWNIYEMNLDGSGLRQITGDFGNCRNPVYLSTFYTIVSSEPWYQLAFTSDAAGEINEYGQGLSTSLYSSRLDGTEVRRLTYNPSSDLHPVLMEDGRLLFSAWQRSTLERGPRGRVALFAANTDGTDYSLFAGDQGWRVKLMPTLTTDGLAVFIESASAPWDGAGRLGAVSLRRNFHSHRFLTPEKDELFHSPSPLPDGWLLVSKRPSDGSATHGIYKFSPPTGEQILVFDHPRYHDVQAKLTSSRKPPDGRSSSASEDVPWGQLYCLNLNTSDLKPDWLPPDSIKRLRILEGVPATLSDSRPNEPKSLDEPNLLQKRILGDLPPARDGSFFIEVPANVPIQIQALDSRGMALRTCGWIWTRNREARGCIGCHEDPELTPENRLVEAVTRPPIQLTLPPERRRLVDFRRDVAPLISEKCSAAGCHGESDTKLVLKPTEGSETDGWRTVYQRLLGHLDRGRGRADSEYFVSPGEARNSPLIWHLFGENTSRPWDAVQPVQLPSVSSHFSDDEKRIFVEWIDLGAHWDGIPARDMPESVQGTTGGDSGEKP